MSKERSRTRWKGCATALGRIAIAPSCSSSTQICCAHAVFTSMPAYGCSSTPGTRAGRSINRRAPIVAREPAHRNQGDAAAAGGVDDAGVAALAVAGTGRGAALMRVAFLSVSSELGGSETSLLLLVQNIRRLRPDWRLTIVVPREGPLARRVREADVERPDPAAATCARPSRRVRRRQRCVGPARRRADGGGRIARRISAPAVGTPGRLSAPSLCTPMDSSCTFSGPGRRERTCRSSGTCTNMSVLVRSLALF